MLVTNLTPYYKIFEDAPIPTAILGAKDLKLEMANDEILHLWGRPSGIRGLTLLDFMPEMSEQSYPDYLHNVARTGRVWKESGAKVILNKAGKELTLFMDYSYSPIKNSSSQTTAILVMATDVTENELNKLVVKQSGRALRAMVMSAPVPMCIYRGVHFEVEFVNDKMLELWQLTKHMNIHILQHVFHHGVPYQITIDEIHYSYTPLDHVIPSSRGICVIATSRLINQFISV